MQAFLDQYGLWLGLIGLVVSVALGVVVFLQAAKLKAMSRKWASLLNGTSNGNIEQMLRDHLSNNETVDRRLGRAEERLNGLETKMESAKRFVGLVRYDAFEDVGGSQSFSLAVYDERGDGAVVTSTVGRTDCRVYAKEIQKGKAERELSPEEQSAITAAVKSRQTAGTAP